MQLLQIHHKQWTPMHLQPLERHAPVPYCLARVLRGLFHALLVDADPYYLFFWKRSFLPIPTPWAEISGHRTSNPGGCARASRCWPNERLARSQILITCRVFCIAGSHLTPCSVKWTYMLPCW
jgi:hypothetical protein